jgi:hypothetical protein
MKVIVCGSRNTIDARSVWRELDRLHDLLKFTELMQGGAPGIDRIAGRWARFKPGVQPHEERAQWRELGRGAGPVRNARMLAWCPDLLIAFPGGKGTADMVRQARAAGVPVHMVDGT